MVGLTLFVSRTRLGKAMRATAYDREAAAMMGIDVDRVIVVTFFIGSALAGAAGVMVGLVFQRVYHFMGFVAGLKGFTAAVIGGIGNIPGAMLGGLVIGLAESFSTGYLSSTFYDADRLRAPDRDAARAADGLLGKAGHHRRSDVAQTAAQPEIGADSWVAQSTSGARPGRLRAGASSACRSAFAFGGFLLAACARSAAVRATST